MVATILQQDSCKKFLKFIIHSACLTTIFVLDVDSFQTVLQLLYYTHITLTVYGSQRVVQLYRVLAANRPTRRWRAPLRRCADARLTCGPSPPVAARQATSTAREAAERDPATPDCKHTQIRIKYIKHGKLFRYFNNTMTHCLCYWCPIIL